VSLLVVGSVALDTVETPHGRVEGILGGSAVYFAYAASYLAPVRLVGVVGEDFPDEYLRFVRARNIDTTGLVVRRGRTFRWSGRYQGDMNAAETVTVDLNVFGEFVPVIPDTYRESQFVFLANGSPALQRHVLRQVPGAAFTVTDTMNHWIRDARAEVEALVRETDATFVNDGEARLLTGEANLVRAGQRILAMGAKYAIIKKGEHGALLFAEHRCYAYPAYPTAEVKDPTGAGDSFAGGVMGHLARVGKVNITTLRQAMLYGTVLASFTVEDFGLNRLARLTVAELEARVSEYRDMLLVSHEGGAQASMGRGGGG